MKNNNRFADIEGRVNTNGMSLPDFKDFMSLKIRNSSINQISEEEVTKSDFSDASSSYERETRARKLVNKSLLWIATQKGFYAQLLSKLNIYGASDENYPTMCTNGFNIQYHPDFVLNQTEPAIRFVLCHEILHCVGDHMSRRGSRDPRIWNWACDYAINPILNSEVELNQFDWPKNKDGSRMGLYEEKYDGMRAEDIYDLLIKDEQQKKKASESFGDDPQDGIHVIDSDRNLSQPDPESIVQDVSGQESDEGQENKSPGQGSSDGPGKKGGSEGEGEGEGKGSASLIGKRVKITAGPDAGKIGRIKEVLPDGDIIIEPV